MTGFLTEIDEQPAALRATLAALKPQMEALGDWQHRLWDGSLRRVILSGMGASYNATIPAQLHLIQHGIDARSIEASELLHYQLPIVTDDTLVILVSQSGRSVEIVKLLDALDKKTPVIGLTNNDDNPLAKQSAVHLQIQAGSEATVSSKTYTCSLAAMHLLVRTLTGEQTGSSFERLYALADAMEAALDGWKQQAEQIVAQIAGSQTIV
ncbi:MAG: SIS domain-containing protein, partial [Anaerolineae bacterium]|nr:SIS domain-containing protein [Anaerolineae bacterium]